MNKTILGIILLLAATGIAGAATPEAPSLEDALETASTAWTLLQKGAWVLGLGLALRALLELSRSPLLGSLLTRVPAKWRVAIPLMLSAASAFFVALAGVITPVAAVVFAPMVGGAAILIHEVSDAGKPTSRRSARAGVFLLAIGICVGGCSLRPATPPMVAPLHNGFATTPSGAILQVNIAQVQGEARGLTALNAWCITRQERRWWSSATAQVLSVMASGLAAAVITHGSNDNNIELGLELGGLFFAAGGAGAQVYSNFQASAHEKHCTNPGLIEESIEESIDRR